MSTQTKNPLYPKELYSQYSWYEKSFLPAIQKGCDEFFLEGFQFDMLSISKNINAMIGKDFYFVTKIRIDKQYDMFFRISEDAVALILDKILGKNNKVFNLNKLTDLEAKILTAFNDYMFGITSKIISDPPAGELRRTNFDVIHLTYLIKDPTMKTCGKFILSIPEALLKPETIVSTGEKFENTTFATSTLPVDILVGSTKFSMFDLKNLAIEDMVIFDNSNIRKMVLKVDDYEQGINLSPNYGLVTPIEDNGGEEMGAKNLWDSIEVEMNAEFDAVKITLGDLKNIEQGNVVDLTSIYDNKVTLRVEDKTIARGDLVIVNDRYGVKITEIIANKQGGQEVAANANYAEDENDYYPQEEQMVHANAPQQMEQSSDDNDEFDYSDFELDDDI